MTDEDLIMVGVLIAVAASLFLLILFYNTINETRKNTEATARILKEVLKKIGDEKE